MSKINVISNSTVLITGGTGTFGSAFLKRCLDEDAKEVRIFSRDEKKQYDMAQMYRKHDNVKFYIGDVREKHSIDTAMYGVDYVFHAAAMKQVPSCESFPMEAIKTNVIGSDNLLTSSIQKHVKKVVCLSTDKAVYPTSAMGMTKAYMEKVTLQRSQSQRVTDMCITRFGNLVASRGSVVPLFIEQVKKGIPITITDPEMTRFLMTVDDAMDLVMMAFAVGKNGEIMVKNAKSCSTGDLAEAIKRYFGLPDSYPVETIGARAGEKTHEALITDEEALCAFEKGDYTVVSPDKRAVGKIQCKYRSEYADRMNAEELDALISHACEGVL